MCCPPLGFNLDQPSAQIKSTNLVVPTIITDSRTVPSNCQGIMRSGISIYLTSVGLGLTLPSFFLYDALVGEYAAQQTAFGCGYQLTTSCGVARVSSQLTCSQSSSVCRSLATDASWFVKVRRCQIADTTAPPARRDHPTHSPCSWALKLRASVALATLAEPDITARAVRLHHSHPPRSHVAPFTQRTHSHPDYCPGSPECSGRGSCELVLEVPRCVCPDGWSGFACEIRTDLPHTVCTPLNPLLLRTH
jgi:hypothetical protein